VHLVGKAIPDVHKKLMDFRIKQCADLGITVKPPPPSAPLHETIDDNYYAPGGESSYRQTKIYFIDADCRVARKETLKITTWTSLGVCNSDRETGRSTGNCKVDIASLSRPPDPGSIRKNIVLDGETRIIAGHSCTFLNNTYFGPSRTCIAREGIFANVVTRATMSYGALLRMEFRISSGGENEIGTFEATDINTNVTIPITTFAPQLSGKYKVNSFSRPNTDSDQ
jgi:hypothetical protein